MGMLEIFYPDETADTSYGIDYEALYRKGYRGLIYDVDNTLARRRTAVQKRCLKGCIPSAFRRCFYRTIRNRA